MLIPFTIPEVSVVMMMIIGVLALLRNRRRDT